MTPFNTLGQIPQSFSQDFSPILSYITSLERHFVSKHPLRSSYLPRFDLEEDTCNYYLYGDLPGANVDDITVEAHEGRTLEVYGTTAHVAIKVEEDGVALHHCQKHGLPESTFYANEQANSNQTHDANSAPDTTHNPNNVRQQPHHHHVLLSERLTGPFRRTFGFPTEIEEEGIKAYMENGVLTLVVPKKLVEAGGKRGKKIPVVRGSWFSGRKNSVVKAEERKSGGD